MARYVPGLEIYGFTNGFTLVPAPPFIPALGTFPIAVSYSWRALWQFQPHQTLPQALLLLAVTLHSPAGGTGSRGLVCQDTPSTPGSPSLSPLLPADPCIQLIFSVKELQRWVCSKTKLFFLKNYVTGIGFGFFSDLLHLWVESCDSVPVSSQCYNLLCRWWLYQLGVFHIHTAFSIKCVGIGSSQSNWTRARGMFWFNCYRWSYSTTKTV